MRKRLLSLWIAIFVWLCASPGHAENKILALASDGVYGTDFSAVCGLGDTLYVYDARMLQSYRLGQDGLSEVGWLHALTAPDGREAYVTHLFANQNKLWGLCAYSGDLWRLLEGGGQLDPQYALRLDFSDPGGSEDSVDVSFFSAAAADGFLCLCGTEEMSDVGDSLLCWSLETGRPVAGLKGGVAFVAPCDDERVLVTIKAEGEEAGEEQPITELYAFAPRTGEITLLAKTELPNTAAALRRQESGTLLALADGRAYTLPMGGESQPSGDGTLALSAYLPWNSGSGVSAGMLGDKHLFLADREGIAIRELDGENLLQGSLVVMNGPDTAQHNAFLREHPEVNVTLTDDAPYSYDELIAGIQTGSVPFDLLGVWLSDIPLERMARKGYLMEITDPELLAVAAQMEPAFIEACTVDGKLYGLPYRCYGDMLSYSKYDWEALGLAKADLPQSFMELLDFVEEWPEAYGEAFPDMMPFWDTNLKDALYRMALNQYLAWLGKSGQPLSLDTELFRALLMRLGVIDFDDLGKKLGFDSDDFWDKSWIFNDMNPINAFEPNDSDARWPLPLREGVETVCPVSLRVMTVSARTQRPDDAMAYLRAVAGNYDPAAEGIWFFPGQNDEVERTGWDDDLVEIQTRLAELEKLLEEDPEDAALLRERIGSLKEMAEATEDYRVAVSREAIALYRRDVSPYLYAERYLPQADVIREIINRFSHGALTLEQAIGEMENRLRLATLEDQ